MEARIFHADDWGMSPAINQGILRLAEVGRLRSASLMATEKYLEHGLADLLRYKNLRLYLHFNLTGGNPLSAPGLRFPSHRQLMLKSLVGSIGHDFVETELQAQWDCLVGLGVPVCGLNGHHHCHLLPGVARPVLDFLRRSGGSILLLKDLDHPWSYLQTQWFRLRYAIQVPVEPCGYLRPRHLQSRAALLRKVKKSVNPLLVHPAAWDDFASSGMVDPLRDYRIEELKLILEHLSDGTRYA
jgi:predicted glycoside hydrolase/deacetylase ChbG (UPF0249 family)